MTIACYARKSNNKLNDSIANQLSIIRSYIKNHDDLKFANVIEFADDGYSGIDMKRNSFQELLAKVRQREIDVIIVKDLSRLGRNYLDVCKLTESIFPFMGIRLIAVSDNYDSSNRRQNAIDLSTAFKAVLNEYYVLEASEKVRSSCIARIRNGGYLGKLPYGYFLSEEKKPIINEEQAIAVRDMYQLYLNGTSLHGIARILNGKGIRSYYGKQWCISSIRRILTNPAYIGTKVSLAKIKDVKTKKVTLNDRSECIIRENAYPPIIYKDIFERTQALMKDVKSPYKSDKTTRHIMAGKLYCVGCNRPLHREDICFRCNNGNVTGLVPCFKGALKQEILYKAVLEKIRQYIEPEIAVYRKSSSFSDAVQIENSITALKEKKAALFDQFFNGGISKERFNELNAAVSSDIAAYEINLNLCRKTISLNTKYKSERPIDTLKRLFMCSDLTREHMQFVQRINVFNAKEFEIIIQPDSPLSVLCKNMDIYEED